MTPGQFITIRKSLDLSISGMAEALRISDRTVYRYELGERKVCGSIARHMEEFRDGKATDE